MDLMNNAIREAYEYAPGDVTYWDTLEINHTSFTTPIRVVKDHRKIRTAIGEFLPVNFSVKLPDTQGNVRGEMTINVDFLPKEAMIQVKDAALSRDEITVRYRQYIATGAEAEPDAELPIPLQVTDIDETHTGISVTAMFPDIVGAHFPRRLMTVEALPGGRI